MESTEPIISTLHARKILGSLKSEGGKIIGSKTLARLVTREGLPFHLDPFGTGRRVFMESEIRTWWAMKLQASTKPIPWPGRPRKPRIKELVAASHRGSGRPRKSDEPSDKPLK